MIVAVGSFRPLRMSCEATRNISWLKKVKIPKTQKQSVILSIFESPGLSLVIMIGAARLQRRYKWFIFLRRHLQKNNNIRTSCKIK